MHAAWYNKRNMSRFFSLLAALLIAFLPLASVHAEGDLGLTPVIISEKAKSRDISKQTLTLTNTSERKLNLFPTVHDVSAKEGDQGFELAGDSGERSTSLANWIELSRGVIELGPGEEKIIPFVIRVNLAAEPGMYHAKIFFSEGSTRTDAEALPPLGEVLVTIEVLPDIKEVLQLNKFFTDSIFLSGDDVLFNFQIENIGNQNLKPTGEIRIYDRSGAEVASIPVNTDGTSFSPEQKAQLASVWAGAEGFGKYKAFLNLDYGDSQRASVQDTVFFWIVPWKQLGLTFIIGAMLVVFLVFYYQRRYDAPLAVSVAPVVRDPEPDFSEPEPAPVSKPERARRSWFSWRKKQSKLVPKVAYLDVPEPEVEAPVPTRIAMHDVVVPVAPVPVRETAPHGHSINLKELCKFPNDCPPEPSVHHVINLKR